MFLSIFKDINTFKKYYSTNFKNMFDNNFKKYF